MGAIRRTHLAAVLAALLVAAGQLAAATRATAAAPTGGDAALRPCSAAFFDGDRRLGPAQLPTRGEVARQLRDYQRTGGLTPQSFLATFWDPAANGGQGGWRFPPDNGYVVGPDGRPEVTQRTLHDGQHIDRYGSEFGAFLAPEGLAYAARSIPPQNLDGTPAAGCNFHEYQVGRPFAVDTGPVAPWFAQPGGGRQYQLDAALVPGAPVPLNVMWLVDNGFLFRID
jgi:nicrotizing toxin Mtb-like protein